MKNLILVVAIILTSTFAFSQSMNVQSAANALKENDLALAKTYIDKAAENEQTSNNYKMWYYRGKVYMAIMNDTSKKVNALDPDAAEKAAKSFMNCISTDKSGWFKEECNDLVWRAGLGVYNAAVDAYNNKDYAKSEKNFKLISEIIPLDKDKNLKRNNVTQEIIYKNLFLTAAKTGRKEESRSYLQKLMDANFNDPGIYRDMERSYLEEKDTAQALKYISLGRTKFEDNAELLADEINIYIAQNKMDVLLQKFTDAIELNPEHEVMYYNRGTIYEKRKQLDSAEADYKKAIELKTDYFDAYYNLGAMIFNQGAEMNNSLDAIKDNKKYEEAKKKVDEKLKSSLPYLEKAYELNAKDRNTLISLKQVYSRLNDQEKYMKVKGELDKLK